MPPMEGGEEPIPDGLLIMLCHIQPYFSITDVMLLIIAWSRRNIKSLKFSLKEKLRIYSLITLDKEMKNHYS